ncbi:hypothetical protein KUV65_15820 [Maritalea mobilis]|uniref:hypothetical protein n=1 Tax=Maritalea mobilis TaxID=483324 RepID=UPI001C96B97D|nr:hypothetical protein [Maritalea mobilis]MBY6202842.1 hypothetical protein [Maritalea mobilis]
MSDFEKENKNNYLSKSAVFLEKRTRATRQCGAGFNKQQLAGRRGRWICTYPIPPDPLVILRLMFSTSAGPLRC